jgi:hypothetical protein
MQTRRSRGNDGPCRRVAASPPRRVALTLLLLASCSKITDPLAQPYVREFRVTGSAPGQQATVTVVSGPPGRINVSGTVPVPNPCFTVEPDVAIRGDVIQLTLYARPSDAKDTVCIQVLSVLSYQAVLGDFKARDYHLTVSHDSGSGPVVEFTKDVTVQ